jgi:hypothetical protein
MAWERGSLFKTIGDSADNACELTKKRKRYQCFMVDPKVNELKREFLVGK